MASLSIPELDTPFIFRSRPEAIPGDLRPLWRIGMVLLVLHIASRGGKSSFRRLHVLNWAIRTSENRKSLRDMIAGKIAPDTVIVRIEPSLNRAVDLAHGEGLVDRVVGDRICRTQRGQTAATALYKEPSIFVEEKRFLEEFGKTLTEQMVNNLLSGR